MVQKYAIFNYLETVGAPVSSPGGAHAPCTRLNLYCGPGLIPAPHPFAASSHFLSIFSYIKKKQNMSLNEPVRIEMSSSKLSPEKMSLFR